MAADPERPDVLATIHKDGTVGINGERITIVQLLKVDWMLAHTLMLRPKMLDPEALGLLRSVAAAYTYIADALDQQTRPSGPMVQ